MLRSATVILALIFAWGMAAAQQPPTIALSSYSYQVGDTLTFNAANLEPNAAYQLQLEPPATASADAETRSATLRTNANGQLRYTAVVKDAGTYVLSISGPRIEATLNVAVSGPPPAPPATAPGEEPEAEPGEEAAPESTAEPSTITEPDSQPSDGEEPVTEPEERVGQPASPPTTEEPAGDEPGAPASDEPTAAPTEESEAPDESTPEGGTTDSSTAPEERTPEPSTGPDEGVPAQTPQDRFVPPSPAGAITTPVGVARLDGTSVVAGDPSAGGWRLDFPADSGATAGLALSADRLLVGHGNSVLTLDPSTGVVQSRYRLPAQVSNITFSGSVALVTVRYASGEEQQVRLLSNGPERLLPFDPDPALYGWLRNEARVADPAARIQQDPTNPFLYLVVAEQAANEPTQSGVGNSTDRALELALDNAVTFYERAQLAESFLTFTPPRQDLATSAMDGALHDFVARGYRPELLTDQELANAYGFPLRPLLSSLGRGNLTQAGFWADWVYRISTPAVPETQAALREYANYLKQNGQRDEAIMWEKRSKEGSRFDLRATLEDAARTVGRTGWYGVAALLVAIVALHLTMLAKYWRPQTLQLKRRRAAGKSVSGVSRLFFMHYATIVEKVVVVLLFAAALAVAALQGWAASGDALPASWGSGSLATPPAISFVADLERSNPEASFVRGYALQSSGNETAAAAAYREIPDNAAALNNLGVIEQDPALYQLALELQPRLASASFNLGEESNPSILLELYQPDEPVVVAPTRGQLRVAVAGSYLAAWGDAFTNPWAALTEMAGVDIAQWLWFVLVVLFLLWAALSILSLFWWQPRLARNAPRTFLYHLLALLLPGTGAADEFWGVFLSVPWAIFGVDLLLHYLPGGPGPVIALRTDIIALILIYVLNVAAFVVEFSSYRRRMEALKRDDPATAGDYGMRTKVA